MRPIFYVNCFFSLFCNTGRAYAHNVHYFFADGDMIRIRGVKVKTLMLRRTMLLKLCIQNIEKEELHA